MTPFDKFCRYSPNLL